MKKTFLIALTFVLTAALFTGCGCTNKNKPDMTTPTGMTETMPTIIPAVPTTMPTTTPTTEATSPSAEESSPTGNGALEDSTTGSTDTTEGGESRSRMMPGSNHSSGSIGNGSGGGIGSGK